MQKLKLLLEKLYLCDKTLGGQMDFGIPGCDKGWIEGRGTYLVANYWCPIRVVETSETVDHFRFEYVGFESSANYNWDEWYLAGRVVPVARGGCKAASTRFRRRGLEEEKRRLTRKITSGTTNNTTSTRGQ